MLLISSTYLSLDAWLFMYGDDALTGDLQGLCWIYSLFRPVYFSLQQKDWQMAHFSPFTDADGGREKCCLNLRQRHLLIGFWDLEIIPWF